MRRERKPQYITQFLSKDGKWENGLIINDGDWSYRSWENAGFREKYLDDWLASLRPGAEARVIMRPHSSSKNSEETIVTPARKHAG